MKNIKLNNAAFKSADNIINEIENRAKKQSRFYTMLFVVIVIAVTIFILDNISIKEYNGYISHKDIKIRAICNMAIVDYHVKPGEIVKEGDTLYSYLVSDWLEDQVNPFTENLATGRKIESDLRIAKYNSEIIEVENTIKSLQVAIEDINKEIASGVKTTDEILGLRLDLIERTERAKHLKRAIESEQEMQSKYNDSIINTTSLTSQGLTERKSKLKMYGKALRYRVAYVDSKIINIKAPHGMVTLKDEDIMTFQPIGHPDMTNSHIEMIVDADEYGDIYDGMEVAVYAGGDFLCDATVSLLGVRMAEAYENMESLLDRSTAINGKLTISLDFKDGYELPEKFYIHNYPVEIRYRVWGDMSHYLNVKELVNE